jgi:hypothetical protein
VPLMPSFELHTVVYMCMPARRVHSACNHGLLPRVGRANATSTKSTQAGSLTI